MLSARVRPLSKIKPCSFCQFAWLFVVGGYKSKGICDERFAVFHATLGHFHDTFGNDLAHSA